MNLETVKLMGRMIRHLPELLQIRWMENSITRRMDQTREIIHQLIKQETEMRQKLMDRKDRPEIEKASLRASVHQTRTRINEGTDLLIEGNKFLTTLQERENQLLAPKKVS